MTTELLWYFFPLEAFFQLCYWIPIHNLLIWTQNSQNMKESSYQSVFKVANLAQYSKLPYMLGWLRKTSLSVSGDGRVVVTFLLLGGILPHSLLALLWDLHTLQLSGGYLTWTVKKWPSKRPYDHKLSVETKGKKWFCSEVHRMECKLDTYI